MTLPRKKSHAITVDEKHYRWMVSHTQGYLNLTVEEEEVPGQILQVHFHPHDMYLKKTDGKWERSRQGLAITPKTVNRLVKHAKINGWEPEGKKGVFRLWEWSQGMPETRVEEKEGEVPLKEIAWDEVNDLRGGVSMDPDIRNPLLKGGPGWKIELPESYPSISERSRELGLRYCVINGGYAGDGFVVFVIQSVQFPEISSFTVNGADVYL